MKKFFKLNFLLIALLLASCTSTAKQKDLFDLDIQISPKVSGSVIPGDGLYKGPIDLTAKANEGWVFYYWETDRQITDNPLKYYVHKDAVVKAVFTPSYNVSLSVEPEGSGSLNYESGVFGGILMLRAEPAPGYIFDHWVGVDSRGQNNPLELKLASDQNIKAVFKKAEYSIDLTGDIHWYKANNPKDFTQICNKIKNIGVGDIMLSPGDVDGPMFVEKLLEEKFGADYLWYPSTGNHDHEREETRDWFRNHNSKDAKLKNVVNYGPSGAEETIYSLDYKDLHIVILNDYYDGKSDFGAYVQRYEKMKDVASIHDGIYNWLKEDLEKNKKKYVLVVGHEPAFPVKDMHNGRIRHYGDSLDQFPELRDRFWNLLKEHNVLGYICGHSHTYSVVDFDGVWQINLASGRGVKYKKSRSSFSKLYYMGDGDFRLNTYRIDKKADKYILEHSTDLK